MDDLIRGQEAAEYVDLSRQRLYLLASQGRIGRKVAGYWVFTKAELDRFRIENPKSKGGRPKKTNSPYAITSS